MLGVRVRIRVGVGVRVSPVICLTTKEPELT